LSASGLNRTHGLPVAVGKIKVIFGLCVFALIAYVGWQVASCEVNNYLLKDDLKDLAAMNGSKIGLAGPESDADLRAAVIRKAREHDIYIATDQIVLRWSGSRDHPVVFIATKYKARVFMPGFALVIHYTATSKA
jgi:hypothetical protein